MIGRIGFFIALATAPAFGQLSMVTVQGATETPVGEAVDFGSVPFGDGADLTFRVKNDGTKLVYLTFLSLSGTDFAIPKRPLLPAAVEAGGILDFAVHFQPDATGSYSATLQANEISTILLGKGVPGLTVLFNQQPLAPGQAIGFGDVQTGSTQTVTLLLTNQSGDALTVGAIAIQGSAFKLAGASPAGSVIASGNSATLKIAFAPTTAGAQHATLAIGVRSYPLLGGGVAPPPAELPKPSIQLDLPSAVSASQGRLSISLSEASKTNASGSVTLSFQSTVAGVDDDPAVTFADGSRSVSFSVVEGSSTGQFGSAASIQFGTGTTAGTLLFTVELGGNSAQNQITIPAAPIGIDAAVGVRNVSCVPADLYCTATNVELQVNGWDNSRTAAQLVFRFFDSSGNPIAPGDIPVDGGQSFRQYFQTSPLGGVFGLHARFPINGDGNQVTAAEVSLTNSAGTARTARIQF